MQARAQVLLPSIAESVDSSFSSTPPHSTKRKLVEPPDKDDIDHTNVKIIKANTIETQYPQHLPLIQQPQHAHLNYVNAHERDKLPTPTTSATHTPLLPSVPELLKFPPLSSSFPSLFPTDTQQSVHAVEARGVYSSPLLSPLPPLPSVPQSHPSLGDTAPTPAFHWNPSFPSFAQQPTQTQHAIPTATTSALLSHMGLPPPQSGFFGTNSAAVVSMHQPTKGQTSAQKPVQQSEGTPKSFHAPTAVTGARDHFRHNF
jgi:hypothetical protein